MKKEENVLKYETAVEDIKNAILQSQHKAIKNANKELLQLYFKIGEYVSRNSRNGCWGRGAIEIISIRLRAEMPGLQGFSATSIKCMRLFYEAWNKLYDKSSNALDDLDNDVSGHFYSIGFSQHCIIIHKIKSLEERINYIKLAAKENLSARTLEKFIAQDVIHHRGVLPNNFQKTIPDSITAQRAIMAFKDEYLLDFINVEQLGARDLEDVDESVIENSIVHNIRNFIMTFGKDFSFIGNQYVVEAFGHTHKINRLFYNRALATLVAVEIKKGNFKPSYLGQLSIYLQVLDDFVRKPWENPSIGIVLCGSAEKAYVEYAVRSYTNPLGVATYKSADEMPEELRKALPNEKQLKGLLER